MNSMKRFRGKFWLLPLMIYVTGCAPPTMRLPVQMKKPAEVTLRGIKILSVSDFGVGPEIDAIVGRDVARKLRTSLLQNGYYELIEEMRLVQALAEHGADDIGQLSAQQYQDIGKSLGVDAFLFGTVGVYAHRDAGEARKIKKTEKKENKTITRTVKGYAVTRTVNVQVSFRIVDSKNGMAVAGISRSVEKTDTNVQPLEVTSKNIFGAITKYKQATGKALTNEEKASILATEHLLPVSVLFDQAFDYLAQQITQTIAPYMTEEIRTLEGGGNKQIKSGNYFASQDLWDDAKEAWESVLDDAEAIKDHPRALYNLGIYQEVNGNLDGAEDYFTQAYKLKDKKLYIDARGRIKERLKELAKLKEQAN